MVKQTLLNKTSLGKVYKFLRLLKRKGIKISQAILFGSYAKGQSNLDSDIDVAIVSNQFGEDHVREMMLLRKLALKIDSHIEPIPLSPWDMQDKYSALVKEIKRHGKVL